MNLGSNPDTRADTHIPRNHDGPFPPIGLTMIDLGLSGKRLQSMELKYTVVLQLSDLYFITVSSPLAIQIDGSRISLDPEKDSEAAFQPVRGLLGRTVDAATADAVGGLSVTLEGGAHLFVGADPDYEAWNVSGPDGALVVSMPGGELAIWSAQPSADEN